MNKSRPKKNKIDDSYNNKIIKDKSNEANKPTIKKKPKKGLTKFQIQAIQKKTYGPELEEIEISLRNRISTLIGSVIPELNDKDYLCLGESDQEDIGITKELDQIVTNLERNGCSNILFRKYGRS